MDHAQGLPPASPPQIIFLHLLATIVAMTLKQTSPPSPSLSILSIAVTLSKSLALLAQRRICGFAQTGIGKLPDALLSMCIQ